MNTTKNVPAPGAVAAGLMSPQMRNGEPCLTDAGLFALAGMMAFSTDPDDDDSRQHCLSGVFRALGAARNGGMEEKWERVILWAFSEHVDPADGSTEGNALAALCRLVSDTVGAGRMSVLIEGRKTH